jgi:phage terminase small subunit
MAMPEDRLNDKQESFCQYYVSGMTTLESANKAGYSKKTAGVIGSTLLNNIKIKDRIAELMKPIQASMINSLIITKESQLKDLENVKQKALKDDLLKIVISAITEQNKMLGFYEAEKKEVTLTGVQIITKDNEMSDLINNLKED